MEELKYLVKHDIPITPKNLTSEMIDWLYNNGAFIPTIHNGGDDYEDADFLKRVTQSSHISEGKLKKFDHIINEVIEPYLQNRFGISDNKIAIDPITEELFEEWVLA